MTIAIGMFCSSCTLAHSVMVIYSWPFLVINSCLLSLVQEWGDPRKEEYYYYMKSYSPVDNVSCNELLFVSPLEHFSNHQARASMLALVCIICC